MNILKREEGRRRIEKEDDLINHRMSWCVGSNSFLIAAYVIAGNAPNGVPYYDTTLIRYLVSISGCVLSTLYFTSILAAYIAIRNWQNTVETEFRIHLFSPKAIAISGSIASVTSPVFLFSIWATLIYSNLDDYQSLSHQILITPVATAILTVIAWTAYYYITDKQG